MAKNPQVNLDITAKDKASDVIEGVAEQVEDLEKAKPVVTVKAKDEASKTLDTVESDAKALDRKDVEIVLRAKADALQSELRKVKSDLEALEKSDTTVTVDADVDPAKRKLADVEDTAARAGGGAGDKFGAGFVRDVGGPLNEGTAGVLGDITDAFSTAGESIGALFGEKAGAQFTAIAGKVATAFGVGSIAYIAVTALWDLFQASAKKAQQRLEEVQATQLLLASGKSFEAVKKLQETYGKAIDNAAQLGLTAKDTTEFILGGADALGKYGSSLDITGDDLADTMTLQGEFSDLTYEQAQALADLLQPLYKARREFEKSGDSLKDLQQEQFQVLQGVDASTEAFLQLADEALPEVRGEILKYVAQVEKIPTKATTVIEALPDEQKVEATRQVLDALAEDREAGIEPILDDGSASATEKALAQLARDRTARVRVVLFDRYGNPIQGTLPGGSVPVPVLAPPAPGATTTAATAPAAAAGGSSGGALTIENHFTIDVKADRTTDQVALGKAIVGAIQSYERLAGATWRR